MKASACLVLLIVTFAAWCGLLFEAADAQSGANIGDLEKVLDATNEVLGIEKKPCDRALSRQARALVQSEIIDYVEKHTPKDYEIFTLCPLQKVYDRYGEEHEHTKRVGPDRWKCTYCKKSPKFRTLEALDLHFETKHSDKLEGGVCLAEHLDYLTGEVGMQDGKCNKEILDDRKYYCNYMMMRCFPPAAHELNDALMQHFQKKYCKKMRCGNAFGPRLLAVLDETRRHPWSHLRLTFVIFALVLAAVFYCGAIVYYREGQMQEDLPARKRGLIVWLTSPFRRRRAKIKKQ